MVTNLKKYLLDESKRKLADTLEEELNRRCRRVLFLVAVAGLFAFLPLIYLDISLYPKEYLMPVLRLGMSLVSLAALLALGRKSLLKQGLLMLTLFSAYAIIATGIITGLSGADGIYVGGFSIILMTSLIVPLPLKNLYSIILIALLAFFGICIYKQINLFDLKVLFSLVNLLTSSIIAAMFIYIQNLRRNNNFYKTKVADNQSREIKEKNQLLQQQQEEMLAQKEMIEKQMKEVKFFNNNIKSSLNYAKTIQEAMLPTEERMKELLKEFFVIYRPKDIVSGDFFWLSKVDNLIFLAVIDCTGHGVPGAFMSMIGNTLLNEIINQNKLTDPAKVLERLHFEVRHGLKQDESGNSNSDGMDIALCSLELTGEDKYKVVFAGAKLPMYYTSKGQLEKLTGERKSVAGWQKGATRYFTSNEILLEKNSTLYLLTDGYTDASNHNRKTLGENLFVNTLEAIVHLPLSEQKQELEKLLEQHQNGTEQRDDITVVGLRL